MELFETAMMVPKWEDGDEVSTIEGKSWFGVVEPHQTRVFVVARIRWVATSGRRDEDEVDGAYVGKDDGGFE